MGEPSVAAEVGLLFRTKRVGEIRAIEAAVRADAEDRAANLRDLLGTRYRDLLAAADTTAAARDDARDAVRDALAGVARSANALRAAFLAGRRGAAAGAAPRAGDLAGDLAARREVCAIGGRLLCLVDSPEVLYACLEGGKVHDAALRFCAAEAAHARLDPAVVSPFVRGRWARVDAFRPQILAAARERSADAGAPVEDVAACFIVEVVLAAGAPAAALDRLLETRTAWVDAALRAGDGGGAGAGGGGQAPATAACGTLASAVRDTVVCCERLFFGDAPLVVEMLGALAGSAATAAAAAVAGMRADGTAAGKVCAWIDAVEAAVLRRGAAVVAGAASARELADAMHCVEGVFAAPDWARGCASAGLVAARGVAILHPVVCERAKRVAGVCVRRAAEAAVADVEAAFDEAAAGSDVGEALWSSVATHAVHWKGGGGAGGAGAGEDVGKELAGTGATLAIVGELERAIGDALADARLLLARVPEVAGALRAAADDCLPSVVLCLKERAAALADEAAGRAAAVERGGGRGGLLKDRDAAAEREVSLERALFVARTAAALAAADHVPGAFTYGLDETAATPALSAFYATAAEASTLAYDAWAARMCIAFEARLRDDLRSVYALEVRSAWDRARRDGGGGGGGAEDAPPCPTAPSPGTLRLVMASCAAANRAGGLALPPRAIDALAAALRAAVVRVFQDTLEAYGKRTEEATAAAARDGVPRLERPENVFLQLLFDARFLSGLLLGGGGGGGAATVGTGGPQFAALVVSLRARIDPINLASVSKVLEEAVESYLARSSVLLGTLTRSCGAGAAAGGSRRVAAWSSVFASASVAAVASPVARFAYLPAPMPSTYTARSGLTAGLGAKAALDLLRSEAAASESNRMRDAESTVVDYASKLSENVGRFGRGFLDSWRNAGQ